MELKYLFVAQYKDGTIFEQTPEDVSKGDPTKSAFFDIRQDDVVRFWLEGEGRTYLVDLTDGHFEIDGVPVWIGDQMPPSTPLRLIFFRQHTHQFNIDCEELAHQVRYCIGWQTTVDRKNVQQVMGVF